MIGLILVTHGKLAEEFVSALEHIVGPQKQILPISIGPEDDVELRRSDILNGLEKVDSGAGVIILTDMFGGTPSNLAMSLLEKGNIEVVAGLNLPMLVKLASLRENHSLQEAARKARDAGQKYIHVASDLLKNTKIP